MCNQNFFPGAKANLLPQAALHLVLSTTQRLQLLLLCTLLLAATSIRAQKGGIQPWLTTPGKESLLYPMPLLHFSNPVGGTSTILINRRQSFQEMDGFGFSLTGGSAQHLMAMSATARAALLKELFGTGKGELGISYLRLSIGASDLNETIFSYNDLPKGATDVNMSKFSLARDTTDVIPVLKEILAIAPRIKIMGSPWSPPAWMKTIYDTRGGRLNPVYYPAYALYFVKYIHMMKKAGIIIDAITVQNEPLHPGNNPSLLMPAPDQADFIKNHLGPAFKKEGIKTKIVIYDHNADRPDYPISILDDKDAKPYIDGSGFHLYGGKIEALTTVHNVHPDKHLYFTEQMVVDRPGARHLNIAPPTTRVMIGGTRNWCRNVLLWNLAADPTFKPYTDRGGCPSCQGAVTIDGDSVTRNLAYYVMGHFSKFVRPGFRRISSSNIDSVANVAFMNADGNVVVVVANKSAASQTFQLQYEGRAVRALLPVGAVATYTW